MEGRYKERNMGDLSCKKEEKERKGGTGQKGMKERVIWQVLNEDQTGLLAKTNPVWAPDGRR